MKKLIFACLSALLLLAGCKTDDGKEKEKGTYLPNARYSEAEVILVMDSAKWHGELGEALVKTFAEKIPGLPQPEPYFSLKPVRASAFKNLFKQAANIIIVMTLDNNSQEGLILKNFFTDESLERIRNNKDLFMFSQENVFAQNQSVMYLFGQNDRQLIEQLEKNKTHLREYFLKKEKSRIANKIYAGKTKDAITKSLISRHQFSLKVPGPYDLAKDEENFVWLRQLGQIDKSVFVYYEPYTSESVFEEQGFLNLRKKIGQTLLVDIQNPSIYMETESLVPPVLRQVNLNGKYAIEARGLWKLSDGSLGGPFISYVFVDEDLNRLYYIEGYVASPGRDKRETIRELEVILNTFKTESELKQAS